MNSLLLIGQEIEAGIVFGTLTVMGVGCLFISLSDEFHLGHQKWSQMQKTRHLLKKPIPLISDGNYPPLECL